MAKKKPTPPRQAPRRRETSRAPSPALLRVPKSVPKAIARTLRLPKAGAFLSYEKAYRLYDALEQNRRAVVREGMAAVRKMERARRPETHRKYMREATAARQAIGTLDTVRSKLERAVGLEPLPPMASPDVRPVAKAEAFSPDYVVKEEGALEWEIGVDYTFEGGFSPQKGMASEVSFNARLFRKDGTPMTESDVRYAMDWFGSTGDMPEGVRVRTVQWRAASGMERESRGQPIRGLQNFQSILMVVGDRGLRVGAVKPDEL